MEYPKGFIITISSKDKIGYSMNHKAFSKAGTAKVQYTLY